MLLKRKNLFATVYTHTYNNASRLPIGIRLSFFFNKKMSSIKIS
jgi:hypothetical protein